MNSKPIRISVAILLFLVGATSLYSGLGGVLDLEEEPFSWFALVSSLLLLFSAYGFFRRFASARYAMYAYLVITLVVVGFIALQIAFTWQLMVAGVFALVTTFYVHQYYRAFERQAARRYSRLKECGFLLIYGGMIFLCLLGASFTEEPRMKTLSGPVSVRN
jgi:hypothetical protein